MNSITITFPKFDPDVEHCLKQVIKGLTYNVKTALKLGKIHHKHFYSDGSYHSRVEILYRRKQDDRFFLAVRDQLGRDSYLLAISSEYAHEWLAQEGVEKTLRTKFAEAMLSMAAA